jgi:Tfp pilus assembly protein PilF
VDGGGGGRRAAGGARTVRRAIALHMTRVFQPKDAGFKRETFGVAVEEKPEREDKKTSEERELRLALRRSPQDVSAVRKLAAFLFDQRAQHEDALQLLRNALGSSLACTDLALDLVSMLLRRPGTLTPESSREMRALLQGALRESNSNSRAYSLQALLLEKEGNRSAARAQHELAVACGAKVSAVVFHNFGCFLEDEGETNAAIEQYQAAIKADSYYTPSLINCAAAVIQGKGDIQHGGELLKRAILVAPNDADVVFNYGRFLEDHERQYTLAADMFLKSSCKERLACMPRNLSRLIVSFCSVAAVGREHRDSLSAILHKSEAGQRACPAIASRPNQVLASTREVFQAVSGVLSHSKQGRAVSHQDLSKSNFEPRFPFSDCSEGVLQAVTCAGTPREISDTWASFGSCLEAKAHA